MTGLRRRESGGQHAPRCRGHNEEMTLARLAWWRGQETQVEYLWYCPREGVEECCESGIPCKMVGPYAVPRAVLEAYGDPGPRYSGPIDEVAVRLVPQGDLDYLLFGGGGPVAKYHRVEKVA